MLPAQLKNTIQQFKFVVQDIRLNFSLKGSIYSEPYDHNYIENFEQVSSLHNLIRWFKKEKSRNNTNTEKNETVKYNKRLTLVPIMYGQRLGILLYALKKIVGSSAPLEAVILRILNCDLDKDECSLLSESIINVEDNGELRMAVKNILKLYSLGASLYEEEIFLVFSSYIFQFREKSKTLYVCYTFNNVSNILIKRLNVLIDAIQMIIANKKFKLLFRSVYKIIKLTSTCQIKTKNLLKFNIIKQFIEARGNEGVNGASFLSTFLPPMLNPDEKSLLTEASGYGIYSTFMATKELINSYLVMNREVKKKDKEDSANLSQSNLIVKNNTITDLSTKNSIETKPNTFDESNFVLVQSNGKKTIDISNFQNLLKNHSAYHDRIKFYAQLLFPNFQNLTMRFYTFVSTYIIAAYYYGDPNSLLPIDSSYKSEKDDTIESPASKDLLTNFLYFANVLDEVSDSIKSKIKGNGLKLAEKQNENCMNHKINLNIRQSNEKENFIENNKTYDFSSDLINHNNTKIDQISDNNKLRIRTSRLKRPFMIKNHMSFRTNVYKKIPVSAPDSSNKRSSIDYSYNFAKKNE